MSILFKEIKTNVVCLSVYPTLYVPNGVSQKNMVDTEDAHLGETTMGRLLILFVHAFI
jgi:hypothetical protein